MKMSKRTVFIVGFLALIILVAGGYFLLKSANTSHHSTAASVSEKKSSSTISLPNTIVFNGSSFAPNTLTVKSGTTITIMNNSSSDMQFDSDPHPIHTDDTDLNVGEVAPGDSMTFTVTKTGSYGYHDHLNPSIQGNLVVK